MEDIIKEVLEDIKIPEYYKSIEKKLIDEVVAIKLGFFADEYYSAKDNLTASNEKNIQINTGKVGSLNRCVRC